MAKNTKNTKAKAAPQRKEPVTLTKTDLIAGVAERAGLTKADAERALNAEYSLIGEFLAENKDAEDGARVQIMGFGTYKTSFVEGRMGRNPQEPDQEIEIPDSYRTHFSAGQKLKDVVNGVEAAKPAKKDSKKAAKGKEAAAPAKKKKKK